MNAIVQGQTEMAPALSSKMVENASNDIRRIGGFLDPTSRV